MITGKEAIRVSEITAEHVGLKAWVRPETAPAEQGPAWCEIVGVESRLHEFYGELWYITTRDEDGCVFETCGYTKIQVVVVRPT